MCKNSIKISTLLAILIVMLVSCTPAGKRGPETDKPAPKEKSANWDTKLNFTFDNGEKPVRIDYVQFFRNKTDITPTCEAAIFADRQSALVSNLPSDIKWMKVYAYGKIDGYQGEEKKELPDSKRVDIYANHYDAVFPFDTESAKSRKSIDYIIQRGNSSLKVKVVPPDSSTDAQTFTPHIGTMWKSGESSIVAYTIKDADGYDVFPQIPAGNYFLHFYYQKRLYFIPFKVGENQRLNLGEYKIPTGSISGKVKFTNDTGNSSIQGVKIHLYLVEYEGMDIIGLCDLSICMAEADIAPDGKYEIKNIPPGKYIITPQIFGWGSSGALVKIKNESPGSLVEIADKAVVKDINN